MKNIFKKQKTWIPACAGMTKGFTLVEFIVILSIFAIMAAVALFNFRGFSSNVGINNLTHDIALTIRQAQVFGWATTSGTIDASTDPQRRAQGVFFDIENNEWSKEFVLYSKGSAGISTNAYFEGELVDVVADTIKIQGANRIAIICASSDRESLLIDPVTNTYNACPNQIQEDFSVAFSRPHPEAMFFAIPQPLTENYVGIYVSSDTNQAQLEHVIIISRLGEIEVQ